MDEDGSIPETEALSPELRGEFLRAWDLDEDALTDEEILLAIKLGHF